MKFLREFWAVRFNTDREFHIFMWGLLTGTIFGSGIVIDWIVHS